MVRLIKRTNRRRLAMSLTDDINKVIQQAVNDLYEQIDTLLQHIPDGIQDILQVKWEAQDVAVNMLALNLQDKNLDEDFYQLADYGIYEYGADLVDELVNKYIATMPTAMMEKT